MCTTFWYLKGSLDRITNMSLTRSQKALVERYCSPTLSQYPQFELRDFPYIGQLLQLKRQEPKPDGKPYSIEEINYECMRIQVDDDGRTLNQTEVWCLFFLHCSLYGVANAVPATSSRGSDTPISKGLSVTVKYKSSDQPYPHFKSQWRKIIEALVLRNSESMLNQINGYALRSLATGGNSYAFNGDTPEYDVDHAVNTFVYNKVISLSFELLGMGLISPLRPTEAKLLVDGKETVVKYRPDLHPLALEGYGNVIVGEVKRPSIGNWIENLGRCNTFKINIEGSNKGLNRGFTEAQSSALRQHIAYQMAGQSLVGYFTDGLFHVVTTIESLVGNVMTVQIDITQLRTGYDESPQNCPPAPLILTRIWEVIQMSTRQCKVFEASIFHRVENWTSREFLNGYFDKEVVTANFERFQEQMGILIQTDEPEPIFCRPIDDDIKQRKLGLYSQVFSIHSDDLSNGYQCSLTGNQIVAKVYDPGRYFLSNYGYERHYDEVIENEISFYRADKERYDAVTRFNEDGGLHDQRINSVETEFAGFQSFWTWKGNEESRDSSNYIASGLTKFEEKLTLKPRSKKHLVSALKQLIIIEHATNNHHGVGDVDVSYENIFLHNEDVVFVNHLSPSTRPNSRRNDELSGPLDEFLTSVDASLFANSIKELLRVWHKHIRKLSFDEVTKDVSRARTQLGLGPVSLV